MGGMSQPDGQHGPRSAAEFATTHWSVVLEAGRSPRQDADQALATLCQGYWYPLYAYVRRHVRDAAEAQDLTQEFFARLLEKDLLAGATPERGRFRSFLLTAMKNFLANQWHRARAQKRGGRRPVLSLDFEAGDSRYGLEPSHDLTPERLYERKWALTLLDRVLGRLREEYSAAGKGAPFELLRPLLGGGRAVAAYADIARQLGMTEGAAKVAAHRMRKRYRILLRHELAQTVVDPADVDDEICWLFKALE
jgi:RNA polymerase sigma factor (sigma-70 family)